jgi:myo-inositol-1(or 4)-monophosphatase
MNNLERRLECAKTIAKAAGVFALNMRDNGNIKVSVKNTNDFVTDCDKATEKFIFNAINKEFPNDGFFGEEDDNVEGNGRWVVDPIDGTTNFFRGLPNWCISIAYEVDKYSPLIGVIYVPCSDELYYAMKGKGSFLNGKRINCSNIDDFSKSLIVCVPPHRHKESYNFYIEKMKAIGDSVSDMRSLGTCAQELCYIAAGCLEGYYELFLGYYDFAAGQVIVEEAGGKLTNASRTEPFKDSCCNIVVSNTLLHKKIEEIIFD